MASKPGRPATSGSFKKGVTGNPGGRPQEIKWLKELARSHTELAINTLAEICRNPAYYEGAAVTAANSLLDRAWGKPETSVSFQDSEGKDLIPTINIVLKSSEE